MKPKATPGNDLKKMKPQKEFYGSTSDKKGPTSKGTPKTADLRGKKK